MRGGIFIFILRLLFLYSGYRVLILEEGFPEPRTGCKGPETDLVQSVTMTNFEIML